MLPRRNVLQPASQEDPFALRERFRLDDVGAAFPFGLALEVEAELAVLAGQHPGEGEEVVVLWKLLLHLHEPLSKEVLPGEDVHS